MGSWKDLSWEFSSEPSLSDHRHVLFNLERPVPVRLIMNPRGTRWDSFREKLKGRLGRGPEMNVKDEAALGLAILFIRPEFRPKCQSPLKPVKTGTYSLKWTPNKESLRRAVSRLFNKGRRGRTPQSSELYRDAQRRKERRYGRRQKKLGGPTALLLTTYPVG